jgi:hypothetical protein
MGYITTCLTCGWEIRYYQNYHSVAGGYAHETCPATVVQLSEGPGWRVRLYVSRSLS